MPTSTRKQREIAEREQLVLDVAAHMLVERGYLGMTMDRIAAATEYSKGTIYQHFRNKEEILAALAVESAERRVALFEKAATFRGRPRERLAAVGIAADLFVELHPLHFRCEGIIGAHSIREKTSEARIQRLEDSEFGCMNVVLGLVRDAVAQGDLRYEDPTTPQTIVLGLWSMASGYHQMAASEDGRLERKLGIEAQDGNALFACYQRYLDGFGWAPLSHEWDYAESVERARREVFAEELARAGRT